MTIKCLNKKYFYTIYLFHLIKFHTIGIILSVIVAIPSYATLSANTARTIQGSKPYLELPDGTKLTNLNQLLGFSIPDGSGGRIQIDASKTTDVVIPTGTKLYDVNTLIPPDGSAYNLSGFTIADTDGDTGSAMGNMKATWYNNGIAIAAADLGHEIDACTNSNLYTLTIEANNVSAQTIYGDPNINTYGSNSKTYNFVAQKICYARPLDMTIQTSITADNKFPGIGYNPAMWDSNKGFSVSAMKAANVVFPTTGFNKASFTLVGSGNTQSVFRCDKVNTNDPVTLSSTNGYGNNCTITYDTISKPTNPITITMQYTQDGGTTWEYIDSYTIPVPLQWGIYKQAAQYANTSNLSSATSFAVLTACSGITTTSITDTTFINRQLYLFRRNEITNTPMADPINYPEGSSFSGSYFGSFVRDADSTFQGEWGVLYNYPGSGFDSRWHDFWTAENNSDSAILYVGQMGYVNSISPNQMDYMTMCRG